MARAWPQVRAALVAFHLVAMFLSAVPTPEGGMNRSTWSDPTVQAELAAWAGRLRMDPDTFEDRLWTVARAYASAYDRLMTPIAPYEDALGSGQSWKMFVAPHRFPTRMEIAGRVGEGEWEVLFDEGDPTRAWRRELLRTERLRSAIFRWGWSNYAGAWTKGCTALAGLAFSDRPALTEVRCRFWKARTPSPDEVRRGERPEGKWTSARLVRRGPDGTPVAAGRPPEKAAGAPAPHAAAAADAAPLAGAGSAAPAGPGSAP